MRTRGLALIVVIGILGVLAALALAFVAMAQMERRASQQRVHAARAYLLARSGVEDALARMETGQASAYGGEDWDGSGTLNGVEASDEVFQRGVLDTDACPAREAMRPSFFAADSLGKPQLLPVDGRKRGFSGRLDGDRQALGNLYILKVEDESAKIDVNGGFLDTQDRDLDLLPDHRDPDVKPPAALPQDTGRGWNFQLARILDVLGQQPEVAVPDLGALAIQNRPAGGYPSIAALQKLLGTTLDLSPYLTVSGWADSKVVHPNAHAAQGTKLVNGVYVIGSQSDVKKTRSALRLEEEGRSPVNLNAAPRSVLVALLQGLQGVSWQDEGIPRTFGIPAAMVGDIADALMAARPFRTWSHFGAFCDALIPGVIHGFQAAGGGGNLCAADLLKANFNPNTGLNKQLADQIAWRWIDKSDLLAWSTEGSLGSTGAFRVSATGRVLAPDGELLAERTLGAGIEAFRLLRQTTQLDFVAGRGRLQDYLSLSSDPIDPTTGASASAAWWGEPPPDRGLGAITTPCPATALPGGAADFDGAVALATIELDRDRIPAPCLFLHHLDDGWDADVGSPPARQAHPDNLLLQADPSAGVWPDPLAAPPANEPGTLYPDGAHLQAGRGVAFMAAGNFPASYTSEDTVPSNHGVFSYWVKPFPLGRYANTYDVSCCRRVGAAFSQFLGTGRWHDKWGVIAESKADALWDPGYERQYHVQHNAFDAARLPGLRWHLVTARFDTDEGAPNQGAHGLDVHLAVWGARGRGSDDRNAGYSEEFSTLETQDLLDPDPLFVLGGQKTHTMTGMLRVASVIDEFAICDFGDAASDAAVEVAKWHAARYKTGRYYKGDDASFLSALLEPRPDRPVRLLRTAWTACLPRESRLEVDVVGAQNPPAAGQPRLIDRDLENAGVAVDLLDEAGTTVLQPLSEGGPVGRTLRRFRYRVTFRNHLTDPLNQPVLETPFFDDITFYYQPAEGPRILRWEGGDG